MLKYGLTENSLTERPDDYTAQVYSAGSLDKEAIIERMLRRGTLLTKTDILAVFNGIEEEVAAVTREGFTVNMPLLNTSFSISGVFEGPLDSFDPNRHRLYVNLTKGTILRDAEMRVPLTKTDAVVSQPHILEVKDAISDTVNKILTPGGVLQLWGSGIKVEGTEAECGLWFVPAIGQPIKATVLVQNKPSSLIAAIPVLPAGTYSLRVVTQYSGGKQLKQPKVCMFDKPLTVAP